MYQLTNAQTEKGRRMIGGQGLYYKNSSEEGPFSYSSSGYNFKPMVGYFIADNLAVGLDLSYGRGRYGGERTFVANEVIGTYSNESEASQYGTGIFARYYSNISPKLKVFIHAQIDYSVEFSEYTETKADSLRQVTRIEASSYETETNRKSVFVGPGLAFFPSSRIGIQATFGSIGYSRSQTINNRFEETRTQNSSGFGVNANSANFMLGFNYHF